VVNSGADLDPFIAGLDYPMFVVTTVRPDTGERAGCLVGFATQSGIDPDRFVVCLSENNHTFRVAAAAEALAVHALDTAHRELAELFGTLSGDRVDKFARCPWRTGPRGMPILTGCPRWFVGDILDRVRLGNHTGYLLAAVESSGEPSAAPLMFSAVRDLEAGHGA